MYKLEVYRNHSKVDEFEAETKQETIDWYINRGWQLCFLDCGCTVYVYKNGEESTWDERKEILFWDVKL